MKTIDVTVLRPAVSGYDSMNEPIVEFVEETESVGVLATPGASSDLSVNRPEGVRVAWTLHFPKSYTKSLQGCQVLLFGNRYRVIGDPQGYMLENTPGLFNRPVEMEAFDG